METIELPNELKPAKSQLPQMFESVGPDPGFSSRLEDPFLQAMRVQQTGRRSLLLPVNLFGFHLISFPQWGIRLVGIGLLFVALVYGIYRAFSPAPILTANQPDRLPLASTQTPTVQPTGLPSATVAVNTPLPSNPGRSQIILNDEDGVSSANLRSCPSTACAVVGEVLADQRATAIGMVSDGSWIQIEYEGAPDGTAWVYGKLVQIISDPPPIVMVLPSPAPFLPAIAPQACVPSGPIEMLLGYIPEHPTQLISGGYVQSGDFVFEIWFGCDTLFGPNAEYSNHYSDIPGLGVHLTLSYRGDTKEGQIVDTWGVEGEGAELRMEGEGSSQSGILAPGITTHLSGIRIPPEFLPSLSNPGGFPLKFVYQARNPQGEWTGAALYFTLINKPDGFYLANIYLQPLSAQELSTQIRGD